MLSPSTTNTKMQVIHYVNRCYPKDIYVAFCVIQNPAMMYARHRRNGPNAVQMVNHGVGPFFLSVNAVLRS